MPGFWEGSRLKNVLRPVSKITVDGDCSHEIKRCFHLGRKDMTNLGKILKSRDVILLTNVCIRKAMFFPSSQVGM